MKLAALLKRIPESSKIRKRFNVRWRNKNEIRKSPVRLINTFRPIEALRKLLIST
jgi:hypothetical protein